MFPLSLGGNKPQHEREGFLRLTLNTIATYITWGQADFYIVGCLDAEALATCTNLQLPCYNATMYANEAGTFKGINWAKLRLAKSVMQAGYHLHLSDLDVAYLKNVQASIKAVFAQTNGAADGSMMQEDWVHEDPARKEKDGTVVPPHRRTIYVVNTGVVFLKANERSIQLMDKMLAFAGNHYQEQYIISWILHDAWADCDAESTCLAVKGHGMAAITRHPPQYKHDNCMPEPGFDVCNSRRLYIHAMCRATTADKEALWRWANVMLIKSHTGEVDEAVLHQKSLPCPPGRQVAWVDRWYTAYTPVDTSGEYGPDGVPPFRLPSGGGQAKNHRQHARHAHTRSTKWHASRSKAGVEVQAWQADASVHEGRQQQRRQHQQAYRRMGMAVGEDEKAIA